MKAIAAPNHQNGAVLVATAIALLVILGMAGLAIDSGHSFSNKTRLQNSVDAAALAAAMKLLAEMQTRINNADYSANVSVANANLAGAAVHNKNLADFGSNWVTSPSAIQFCWSKNLQDFSTCETSFKVLKNNVDTAFFVRAEVTTTSTQNFIMQVIPGISPTRSVGAVAVAGTIGHLYDCNISPFYVCDNSSPTDEDCSDGSCFGNPVTNDPTADPDPTHFFAINMDSHYLLPAVTNPPCTPTTVPQDGCVWVQDTNNLTNPLSNAIITKAADSGSDSTQWDFNKNINFNGNRLLLNLININGQSEGGRVVRENIIYPTACIDPNSANTQPGNMTSIRHAFNALFGEPGGDVANFPNIGDYADWVTDNPISFRYYKLRYDAAETAGTITKNTRYHQRLRNVPVVDCPSPMGGNIAPVDINGYACFFFSRKIYKNETGKLKNNEDFIIAEHVDKTWCPPVEGVQGGDPNNILDAKIVLFQYYGSSHS